MYFWYIWCQINTELPTLNCNLASTSRGLFSLAIKITYDWNLAMRSKSNIFAQTKISIYTLGSIHLLHSDSAHPQLQQHRVGPNCSKLTYFSIRNYFEGTPPVKLLDSGVSFTMQVKWYMFCVSIHHTTLQFLMNTELSQHKFWPCHENRLIKTIQTIPPTTYLWVSSRLPFTVV